VLKECVREEKRDIKIGKHNLTISMLGSDQMMRLVA